MIGSSCLEHCVEKNSEEASGLSKEEFRDQHVEKCVGVESGP